MRPGRVQVPPATDPVGHRCSFLPVAGCDILTPVHVGVDTGGKLTTAANALTLLRIVAIPVIVVLILRSGDGSSAAATAVFIAAALTDFFDGLLARRTATITELGRILDPLADRLLIGATVIALTIAGALPLAGVVLVVARDIFLIVGYKFMERRAVIIRVSFIGKSYTALFMVAIIAVMADIEPGGVNLGMWMFWLGVAGSLISGAGYLVHGIRLLRGKPAN